MPIYSPTSKSRIHFYEPRGLRRRVFLTQLPLTVVVAFAVAVIGIFNREAFDKPALIAALAIHSLLLAAACAVHWDKLPRGAFLVLPYVDFVAIALFRAANPEFPAVVMLIFFPVFWVTVSGLARKTAVAVSVAAACLVVYLPALMSVPGLTPELFVRSLLFPLVVFAFALTVVAFTTTVNTQRVELETKDRQLREALVATLKRERLLQTVVDSVPVGLLVVDADGNDVLMNTAQRVLHASALPPDIAAPQEKDLLVFAADAVTSVAAEDRPVRRAIRGEEFTHYQLWIGSGDTARAISTAARPMLDLQGNFDGAVIVFQDNTKMMAALEAKNDFVANVSHEFRTPLTSIQGYLEMVLEAPADLPAHAHKYLSIAARNVDRLSSLVSDLLTTETVSLQLARADVSQLVSDSVATATPAAEINKVTLHAVVSAPLEAFIDARRVGQVLDNLVSNAIKYSPDGGTVTVRMWANGADLLCEVQDTGMGMSDDEQAEAFVKFFRARSAVQRSIPGVGLGLMISKTIVTNHGGTMNLCSKPGVGTTIGFVLPRCLATVHGRPKEIKAAVDVLADDQAPRRLGYGSVRDATHGPSHDAGRGISGR